MTRVFDDSGKSVPVTVVEVGPCVVTQIRTSERDGYSAVQLGYGEIKPRNSSIPMIAHDAKAGSPARRHHREFRMTADEASGFEVGQEITLKDLEGVSYVDIVGRSKGKGFAGGMKRHGFKGQLASHGVERKHRSPGSIGGHASNAGMSGRIKKGKKMSGHLGDERVTVRSLDIIRTDPERNLILVKGPVPGSNKSLLELRPAKRLYKSKGEKKA